MLPSKVQMGVDGVADRVDRVVTEDRLNLRRVQRAELAVVGGLAELSKFGAG